MKNLITSLLILCAFSSQAAVNYSKDGEILEPGIYRAIHARNEVDAYKLGKGSSKKIMHHLLLSAGYGFKGSMKAISAIYQNGDYGFEKDLPLSFAWAKIAYGKSGGIYNAQFDFLQKTLTNEQHVQAVQLYDQLYKRYNPELNFKKFQKWFDDASTTTGSRVKGKHSYLNLQVTTNTGRNLSAFDFLNKLDKIYAKRKAESYEVIQHKIQTIDSPEDEDKREQ